VSQPFEKIDVRIPTEAINALEAIANERKEAEQKNISPSDIMREALAEYLERQGRVVSFKTNRGGVRIRRKATA
jgi:hypothetical protein